MICCTMHVFSFGFQGVGFLFGWFGGWGVAARCNMRPTFPQQKQGFPPLIRGTHPFLLWGANNFLGTQEGQLSCKMCSWYFIRSISTSVAIQYHAHRLLGTPRGRQLWYSSLFRFS